ncbi:MAG: peptidoglycan DD-metalloendopeptidase family protein [Rikenellaceae bacterium]
MKQYIKYLPLLVAAILLGYYLMSPSTDTIESPLTEPITPENRVYGIIADGYAIDNSTIKQGEAMGTILSSYGKSSRECYLLEKASKQVFPLNKIRGGNHYSTFVRTDSLGVDQLDYLVYDISKTEYVVFSFVADSIAAYTGHKQTTTQRHNRTATIKSSMWGAIIDADLPYALGAEIENIYQWTVDFFSIKEGDNFTVIYDEMFVDDTVSIGLGQIWGARFEHSGKNYYAVPFKQDGKVQFWEEDGASLRKMMLKAPLKYTRISSGFSYARLHPIYKVYKPHTGVDYAAPAGTPVHSVADGVVTFKGWGGGGGNTVKIKHPGGFVTGYLHLKGYASGIYSGATVKQGQTIGYVGSTGDSTGPHLDYRIWKGGMPINPLKVPQEPQEPISAENRELFEYVKGRVIAELNGEKINERDMIVSLDSIKINHVDSILYHCGMEYLSNSFRRVEGGDKSL